MSEMQSEHGISTRAGRLERALASAFAPSVLRVVDDSARHAGHAGARAQGETHYTILIVSEAFAGLNRVARHRAVNEVLATEFSSGLHALSLILQTPQEQSEKA